VYTLSDGLVTKQPFFVWQHSLSPPGHGLAGSHRSPFEPDTALGIWNLSEGLGPSHWMGQASRGRTTEFTALSMSNGLPLHYRITSYCVPSCLPRLCLPAGRLLPLIRRGELRTPPMGTTSVFLELSKKRKVSPGCRWNRSSNDGMIQ
jgi:hypothetical protein